LDYSSLFKNKIIVVFGGTGTIGSQIVKHLLNFDPKSIRIFSNSENELWRIKLRYKSSNKKLRFLLGDIRNSERVSRAIEGADFVFNAAALKHVPICEYNPMEAVNVNIHGLENIIEGCLKNNVKKLIHISTDKAVDPSTVMGATKMIGERLTISRAVAKGKHSTIISCVRFGNVLGSRGSIIPLVKRQIRQGNIVTLTDRNMKRFFLSIEQAVELVLKAAYSAKGGEIFVFKMPIIKISDLIEIIIEEYAPIIGKDPSSIQIETIGPRFTEKIDELLIAPTEFSACYETEHMYIIYSMINFGYEGDIKFENINGKKVAVDEYFSYSTENAVLLKKEDLREHLKKLNLI